MLRSTICVLVAASGLRADILHDSLARMYNFDFASSHKLLDRYIAANPKQPLGPTFRAAAYLFYELDRLRILQGEFFSDDKRISGNDRLKPDPKVREQFLAAVAEAQALATERLKTEPGDPDALFSFAITEGLRVDYMAFIEKKQLRSLLVARKSHQHAVELLKRDPKYVDAYLTTGITEYLVGSLPFFVKWFVKFDGTQGSKQQAVTNLEKVASEGRYLGPFARILLSIIYLREKQPLKSMQMLEGLTREFPENALLQTELEKLRRKYGSRTRDGNVAGASE